MKYCTSLLIALLILPFAFAQDPPRAKKVTTVFEEFGNKRTDDYYWMKEKNDPAVLEYIKEENVYAEAMLQQLEPLQAKLFEEMKARQAKTFSSLPIKRNGWWYYNRTTEGKAYPVYYRRKGSMNSKEETIQDVNDLAAGKKVFFFQPPVISPNNQLAAFKTSTRGDRRATISIKDLGTGKMLTDSVSDNASYSLVWTNDSRQFFYVVYDKTIRPYKVMLHTLGTAYENDKEIWQEKDSTFWVSLYPSSDRKYLFINSASPTSSEVYYLSLATPQQAPRSVSSRQTNVEYRVVDHANNLFYLHTNFKAPNYRIVTTSISNKEKEQWKDVIPAREYVYIEPQVALRDNKIVSSQRINGASVISIYDLTTKDSHNIKFEEEAYSVYLSLPDDNLLSDSIRLWFSSYAVPAIDYSYNLRTGKKTMIRQEVVNNFSSSNYETKLFQVPVRDGELVPVSMVYNKNLYKADGKHPLLLNTYSWYGVVFDPWFSSTLISLLDRGFASVYIHARGGSEKGPGWWKAGRRLNRNNTFYDVVDAAQYLVDQNYTSPDKLVALGQSAGGTNIGAMVNLRPDLFKAMVADVPWLDVITDMKDPNVPLVTAEYEEEGDPNIEAEYKYMLTWSPYDNVKKAAYPAILATAGWHDTNVPFYHAAKWVAKIRENNLGRAPVLLLTNLDAGHGGTSDRFGRMKATAMKYAFLLDAVGIRK